METKNKMNKVIITLILIALMIVVNGCEGYEEKAVDYCNAREGEYIDMTYDGKKPTANINLNKSGDIKSVDIKMVKVWKLKCMYRGYEEREYLISKRTWKEEKCHTSNSGTTIHCNHYINRYEIISYKEYRVR